jgi:hypothetical protein
MKSVNIFLVYALILCVLIEELYTYSESNIVSITFFTLFFFVSSFYSVKFALKNGFSILFECKKNVFFFVLYSFVLAGYAKNRFIPLIKSSQEASSILQNGFLNYTTVQSLFHFVSDQSYELTLLFSPFWIFSITFILSDVLSQQRRVLQSPLVQIIFVALLYLSLRVLHDEYAYFFGSFTFPRVIPHAYFYFIVQCLFIISIVKVSSVFFFKLKKKRLELEVSNQQTPLAHIVSYIRYIYLEIFLLIFSIAAFYISYTIYPSALRFDEYNFQKNYVLLKSFMKSTSLQQFFFGAYDTEKIRKAFSWTFLSNQYPAYFFTRSLYFGGISILFLYSISLWNFCSLVLYEKMYYSENTLSVFPSSLFINSYVKKICITAILFLLLFIGPLTPLFYIVTSFFFFSSRKAVQELHQTKTYIHSLHILGTNERYTAPQGIVLNNNEVRNYKQRQLIYVLKIFFIVVVGLELFYFFIVCLKSRNIFAERLIPSTVLQQTLAAEDVLFPIHNGIDYARLKWTLRDTLKNLRFEKGGSTISMQLAKMLFLYNDKTIFRKLHQIFFAILLESFYSKQKLLNGYLHVLPFGHSTVGIFEASQKYYNKDIQSLTFQESLDLIMTIPDPAFYNPSVTVKPNRITEREEGIRKNYVVFSEEFRKFLSNRLSLS